MAHAAHAETVAAVGEFRFLTRLLPRLGSGPGTIVGPGQDCAVVRCGARRLLYTVDALVEGVHFEPHWLTPRQLGRKSFLVSASDIAAMGGRPRFCVVSAGVPLSYPTRDLAALHAGIVAAARDCGLQKRRSQESGPAFERRSERAAYRFRPSLARGCYRARV